MKLSPHFTLEELTTTSTGLPNRPDKPQELASLRALCSAVLEPWRELAGGPFIVNSGFRSDAVNEAVGGSPTSQHRKGEAADVVPPDRLQAWYILMELMDDGLPVDQAIIYEGTNHVHVSHTHRHIARRDRLVKTLEGKYVKWETYNGDLS